MRAACWHGPHDVRIDRVPDPALVNPRDAIVRVTLSAICGSDLHLYGGLVPGMREGDVLGHEFLGEVVDLGPEVRRLKLGDRVVVSSLIACGQCWFCKNELYAACDNSNPGPSAEAEGALYGHAGAALFGYSHLFGGYAGGQAEYVRVPFADVGCLPLRPGCAVAPDKLIFLTDALPTAWMAVEHCDVQPGDEIAVFGCGPVGQLAIQCAYHLGAARVIAIDRVPARLELARVHGKATVIDERDGDVLERLAELTGGRGPDACIDAVGLEAHGRGGRSLAARVAQAARPETDRPDVLRTAILACRKAGTISIPGVYGGVVDHLPVGAAFAKGLTFRMGQTHVQRYTRTLLEKLEAGELDPSYVVTHRVTLDEVPRAYDTFARKEDGCVKVLIRP